MANTITGACHCGCIKYAVTGKPRLVVNCHCDSCKKRNGSAFSTYLAIPENGFAVIHGHEQLKEYEVSDEGSKYFCAQCGSPIYNKNNNYPDLIMLFYGSLSNNLDIKPAFNVYCENKCNWLDGIGQLKSFERGIER